MPQTERTVNNLIRQSFYQIGELSPDETPSDSLISTGLSLLNDLLDSFAGDGTHIPFIKEITFNLVAGKDIYSISNAVSADITAERIASLEFVNIINTNISYPVRIIDRAELFGNIRLTNLGDRPNYVILDRQELQSNIQFYPVPSIAYECVLRAKFMLDELNEFSVISEVPRWFYRYLRYALARELKSFYPSSNWSETDEQTYQKLSKMIQADSDNNYLIEPDGILMSPYENSVNRLYGTT